MTWKETFGKEMIDNINSRGELEIKSKLLLSMDAISFKVLDKKSDKERIFYMSGLESFLFGLPHLIMKIACATTSIKLDDAEILVIG